MSAFGIWRGHVVTIEALRDIEAVEDILRELVLRSPLYCEACGTFQEELDPPMSEEYLRARLDELKKGRPGG